MNLLGKRNLVFILDFFTVLAGRAMVIKPFEKYTLNFMEHANPKTVSGVKGTIVDSSKYSIECVVFSDGPQVPKLKKNAEFVFISGCTILKG